MMELHKWELVGEETNATPNAYTDRFPVPGGWLYHVAHSILKTSSMCFVPDIKSTPEDLMLAECKGYHEGVIKGYQEGYEAAHKQYVQVAPNEPATKEYVDEVIDQCNKQFDELNKKDLPPTFYDDH